VVVKRQQESPLLFLYALERRKKYPTTRKVDHFDLQARISDAKVIPRPKMSSAAGDV